ncbi:hypothetical protein GCM10007423_63550 [Dyadobacter endophyticus]|uniref:Uncharacterized protein n=1 Tax=Dyadobacter endophyticus TaxID=1749036 RepID=A0ABQ1ZAM9_9BACT|nr:DUF3127 domain-containing protein [Dyadobacter endophyticus]GGH55715.1 hypothetical protein GCM10007423_63550 [Dyadobacter endophyticus]
MFSTKLKILSIKDPEDIKSGGKSLQVRWIFGLVNDKNVAFKLWNDLANDPKLILENEIEVEFKIESRENNGRFFTDLTIIKII